MDAEVKEAAAEAGQAAEERLAVDADADGDEDMGLSEGT